MSAKYIPKKLQKRPGELTLKEFVMDEAQRTGLSESAIYNRIYAGTYVGLKRRRTSSRAVFVKP